MPIRVTVGLLVAALSLSPPAAVGQQPVEVAFADPQPHFVAAWAPTNAREAERSAVLARRLSLELADVSLDAALKALANRAGLNIIYSPAILPAGKRVTIQASDIAVVAALTEILFRSGLDVVVDRDGTLALVVCRHQASRHEVQDSGTIVGTVTDKATGSPLMGATVMVDGGKRTVTTGEAGKYRIQGVEQGTYIVGARYVGYARLTRRVVVRGGADVRVDFALEKSVQKLNELVTTGTILPTEVKAIPTPVSVISAEDISVQQPHTVQELFRQSIPSGISWDPAAFPFQTTFSVRGASTLSAGSGQMKVFVDGIEAGSPTTAAVDPSSIEKVEVIRGPQAAAIYGSDAIGGVIQIFTKRGDSTLVRPQVEAQTAIGVIQTPYDGFGGVLRENFTGSIRGGGSNVSYNFGAGYSHTGDWLPNGEISRQANPSVFGGIHLGRGIMTIGMSGRYYVQSTPSVNNPDLAKTGFVGFSKPNYVPGEVRNQTFGARIGVAPTRYWNSTLTAGIDRATTEQSQIRPRLTSPDDTLLQVFNEELTKTSVGLSSSVFGLLSPNLSGSVTVGFDHWSLPISRFFASGALNTEGTIRPGPGGSISASQTTTRNTGYFAQVQLGLRDALFLTGGLRAEHNTDFGDSLGVPVSPRVGLTYTTLVGATTFKIRGSYGKAIRAPAPGQKLGLITTSITLPNFNLGPERQRGWDAGVDIVAGHRGAFSFTYFDQVAENLIQQVLLQASPTQTYQFQNVGRVKNFGIELEGTLYLGAAQLKGQYAYARSRIDRLAPGYSGDLRIGDQSVLTPKHTAGASITVTPSRSTTASAGLTYVGEWTYYDFLAFYSCLGQTGPCRQGPGLRSYFTDYPGFIKANITLWQQIIPLISGFLSMDNLTNSHAFEFYNLTPVMGRITTIGLRLQY